MTTAPKTSKPAAAQVARSRLGDWLKRHAQRALAEPYDLQLLACSQLGLSRAQLLVHPERELSSTEIKALDHLANRLHAGEPLAYLLGKQGFWDLELTVTPDVLIPRPETELLVELALAKAALLLTSNHSPRIVELGTGSGAISIALAQELHKEPTATPTIIATDYSLRALRVAQGNAHRLQASEAPIVLIQSDWLAAIGSGIDLLVSNPPYIAAADPHLPALTFEPSSALVAGIQGLDDIKKISEQARSRLNPGAWLLLEHGYQQGAAVRQLLEQQGFTNISTEADLAGLDRVTLGQQPHLDLKSEPNA